MRKWSLSGDSDLSLWVEIYLYREKKKLYLIEHLKITFPTLDWYHIDDRHKLSAIWLSLGVKISTFPP